MTLPVVLVVAVARNGVIGTGNALPWHIGSDLKRFKALTMGTPMVMGRKTFQSIGRPLPGRETVVVTRAADFSPEGVHVAPSVEAALARARDLAVRMKAPAITVVGGGEIYAQTIAVADRLEVTEVDAAPEGDARFPAIDPLQWREVARMDRPAGERDDHAYAFVTYERRPAH